MSRIHVLPLETARLIAAGEVIDRPASALRELIDNAVDSGAALIRIEVEKGGIELIRVSDNGSGMAKEDLELSIRDHATSKISTADDLLKAKTLGFRGEALASIAAVARLEILSRERGYGTGWRLSKTPGEEMRMEPAASSEGTTVTVRGIFEHFPARRQFLKSPSHEGGQCRNTFAERALALPQTAFSWSGGKDIFNLPPSGSKERISLLYPELPSPALSEFTWSMDGASFVLVYADPSFHRPDRKYLQVFVNRRRVQEWGLLSVAEYAFSPWLPGGMRPAVFVMAEISPELADFNIHPAKREVRIKNLELIKSGLHRAFSEHLKSEFGSGPVDMSGAESTSSWLLGDKAANLAGRPSWSAEARQPFGFDWKNLPSDLKTCSPAIEPDGAQSTLSAPLALDENHVKPRYLGRAFGPYLVAERDEILYLVDQHAAHERIIYDQLKRSGSSSQPLLVPHIIECDAKGQAWIKAEKQFLERLGYAFELQGDYLAINAVPAFLGEKALPAIAEILESPDSISSARVDDLIARIACRAAVKDGEILDDASARELVEQAFLLPFPRCPHGRPIWASFQKGLLDRMVGRVIA